jgi:hypothetical protein
MLISGLAWRYWAEAVFATIPLSSLLCPGRQAAQPVSAVRLNIMTRVRNMLPQTDIVTCDCPA